MKKFTHISAKTVEEAVSALRMYGKNASIIAGGTDLLGKMKDAILPHYPEALIDIKRIPGLDAITIVGGEISIGATTRLEDIAQNDIVKEKLPALAKAAVRTASPHIREMGTIAGNICQDIRCWYYRNPDNRFPCLRKGGGRCYAIEGDNRFHSIFGGSVDQGCYAVHPSDTAPALLALNATIETSKRTIPIDSFFDVGESKTTVLEDDEFITRILIPETSARNSFIKFAQRKSIDFPIVNCAAAVKMDGDVVSSARIFLNAVHVKPYRATQAEAYITGKSIDEATAESAGETVLPDTLPMTGNGYMTRLAVVMIKRTILACGRP